MKKEVKTRKLSISSCVVEIGKIRFDILITVIILLMSSVNLKANNPTHTIYSCRVVFYRTPPCNLYESVFYKKEFGMQKEIWKDIKGQEGFYQVSNIGRIRGVERHVKRGNYFLKVPSKVLYTYFSKKGYPTVILCRNGKTSTYVIHRLVGFAFISNPENKPQINHKDGIKTNNNVENLEWCTNRENHDHAMRMGLRKFARGEACRKKLKEEDVLYIRKHYKYLDGQKLADKFHVSKTNILNIIHRKVWRHI